MDRDYRRTDTELQRMMEERLLPVKRWTVWPKTWVTSISRIIESWKDVIPCQNLASGLERRF